MLLRERHGIGDIARIQDFGGGGVALVQERLLAEAPAKRQHRAQPERGRPVPHVSSRSRRLAFVQGRFDSVTL